MQTVAELREHADQKLFGGSHHEALHAYALLVQLQPNDLDARLRMADTLLAMGEVQAAAYVYTLFARHACNGGYPLRAIVAVKVLEALEPELGALTDQIAAVYGKGSERLGRGVRLSLGREQASLPEGFLLDSPPPPEELLPAAARIAADLSRIAAYPEAVPPIPVFSQLPKDVFAELLKRVTLRRTGTGETLITAGEVGESFFVLVRGRVRVTSAKGAPLAELRDGAVFGEMALVSDQPRSASVVTEDDCDLLEFDRKHLESWTADVSALGAALRGFARQRLLKNLMATSPLFAPLSETQRVDLMARFTAHEVPAGTSLIREGEPGRGLYLLLTGEAEVSKDAGGQAMVVATLFPSDVFGEIALVLEKETTANVVATKNSTVLFLARELFDKLADAFEEIRAYVEELGDERLMDTRISMTAPPPPPEAMEFEIDVDVLL
ncbi:MAG: cyclic nucleotide-binding domain-containing protein [Myxococcota bacterium]